MLKNEIIMTKIKVIAEKINGYCNLPILIGDYFYIVDSKIIIPEGKHVCLWALQSMMPIFPILAVKEKLDDNHWVKNTQIFSCPDPKGLVQYRIIVEEP